MRIPKREYYNYIKSEAWQETRRRYFRSKLPKWCWICGCQDKPLDLHHTTYKTLGRENLNHLRLVCRPCHNQIHENARKSGKHLWEVTTKMHRKNKKRLYKLFQQEC